MLRDQLLMQFKLFDNSGRGQATTFMYKRNEFKHENEVRLIYNSQNNNELDIFSFNIDPFLMFDEIIFDPRMDESLFFRLKNEVINWGFQNKIEQSNLYKLKNFSIILNTH